MKNILFSTLVLFTFFAFTSCNTKEAVKDQIDLELILDDSNQEKAKLTSGKIIIEEVDDLKIIAIVEDEHAGEHLAYYYQLEGTDILPNAIIKNGTVLFLEEYIVIRDNNSNKQYSISLIDQPFNQYSEHSSSLTMDKEVEAVGIGETQVTLSEEIGSRNPTVIVAVGTCKCKRKNIIPFATCKYGGPGTNFCWCCGCFIHCGAGFYSCCNP